MKNATIMPLFSKVVFSSTLENSFDLDYEKLKNRYPINNCSRDPNDSSRSESLYVLNDFSKLKREICTTFDTFKNDVLGYHKTKFEMTTSWITKTSKNQRSKLHCHKNSFYSGVLYLDDIISGKSGSLNLCDFQSNSFLPNEPTEFTIYNSTSWEINPSKNLLIFFPSEVFHEITLHESDTPRYSIAFNFFPVGSIGSLDSTIKIKI
jgi:uncharacterized protein (TIGR02466 family)|tara:strand:+ start:1433 stop:2053 length:621 start_codon:yes stop_codon:yes gene_type:complete